MAVYESWARTSDPAARTAPARAKAVRRFEDMVDPDRVLPEAERLRRADAKRRAYFTRLAYLSAKARNKGKAPAA